MTITSKIIAIFAALLSLLGLVGCNSATPTSVPTFDTNSLRTEVAATIFAQVTQDLARTPSVTPSPLPTATFAPTSMPAQATTPPATGVAGGTATPTSSTPEAGNNLAEWVSQSIADKTVFAPGEVFTMTWQLKNTGASTWAANYMLRFYSGDPLGSPKEVLLKKEVPPGQTVDITLHMKAPIKPGTYTSVWVMSTANRSNFKEPVYLQIVVAIPVTPTPTR